MAPASIDTEVAPTSIAIEVAPKSMATEVAIQSTYIELATKQPIRIVWHVYLSLSSGRHQPRLV